MSNLWVNIRFGKRHLQIGPDRPYVTFKINPYYIDRKPDKWFEVFTFFH